MHAEEAGSVFLDTIVRCHSSTLAALDAEYTVIKKLGTGNFGKVVLAKSQLTEEYVAIKIIARSVIGTEVPIEQVVREIRLLSVLRHPNIARLHKVVATDSSIYLVMEYCAGGELFDFLVLHGKLKEPQARSFFRQILSAVDYCHNNFVIHRDLKLENLLLDGQHHIKVIDFGLANAFSEGSLLHTACGTPEYAPPEVLMGKSYKGPGNDVWALGVILFAMIAGAMPYGKKEGKATSSEMIHMMKYSRPCFPPGLENSAVAELVLKLLTFEEALRPTMADIFAHRWVADGTGDLRDELSRGVVTIPRVPVTCLDEDVLRELQLLGYDYAQVCDAVCGPTLKRSLTAAAYFLVAERRKADCDDECDTQCDTQRLRRGNAPRPHVAEDCASDASALANTVAFSQTVTDPVRSLAATAVHSTEAVTLHSNTIPFNIASASPEKRTPVNEVSRPKQSPGASAIPTSPPAALAPTLLGQDVRRTTTSAAGGGVVPVIMPSRRKPNSPTKSAGVAPTSTAAGAGSLPTAAPTVITSPPTRATAPCAVISSTFPAQDAAAPAMSASLPLADTNPLGVTPGLCSAIPVESSTSSPACADIQQAAAAQCASLASPPAVTHASASAASPKSRANLSTTAPAGVLPLNSDNVPAMSSPLDANACGVTAPPDRDKHQPKSRRSRTLSQPESCQVTIERTPARDHDAGEPTSPSRASRLSRNRRRRRRRHRRRAGVDREGKPGPLPSGRRSDTSSCSDTTESHLSDSDDNQKANGKKRGGHRLKAPETLRPNGSYDSVGAHGLSENMSYDSLGAPVLRANMSVDSVGVPGLRVNMSVDSLPAPGLRSEMSFDSVHGAGLRANVSYDSLGKTATTISASRDDLPSAGGSVCHRSSESLGVTRIDSQALGASAFHRSYDSLALSTVPENAEAQFGAPVFRKSFDSVGAAAVAVSIREREARHRRNAPKPRRSFDSLGVTVMTSSASREDESFSHAGASLFSDELHSIDSSPRSVGHLVGSPEIKPLTLLGRASPVTALPPLQPMGPGLRPRSRLYEGNRSPVDSRQPEHAARAPVRANPALLARMGPMRRASEGVPAMEHGATHPRQLGARHQVHPGAPQRRFSGQNVPPTSGSTTPLSGSGRATPVLAAVHGHGDERRKSSLTPRAAILAASAVADAKDQRRFSFGVMAKFRSKTQNRGNPRVVTSGPFSFATTSSLPVSEVMLAVEVGLRRCCIDFTQEKFTYTASCMGRDRSLQFEIEVCEVGKMGLRGVRFHRLDGDSWDYKARVSQVLAELAL